MWQDPTQAETGVARAARPREIPRGTVHRSCASTQPSHPTGQAQGRGCAVSWQPCREIWAEMQLAKGEFTVLLLFGFLQPFSEQWVTQESWQGSGSSTGVSPVLQKDALDLNDDRCPWAWFCFSCSRQHHQGCEVLWLTWRVSAWASY